jgi:hypothetical protein
MKQEAQAMRLPRPRFTVRRMMIGVAITAPLAWAFATAYRAAVYERLADFHDAQMIPIGSLGAVWGEFHGEEGELLYYGRDGKMLTEREVAWNRWHARLKRKYRAAAGEPWRPLEPDPPEPK